MQVRYAQATRFSRNLGVVPLDREGERSVAEYSEIVAIVGVLRDPLSRKDQVVPESLLDAHVEFIAKTRTQRVPHRRVRRTGQQRIQHRIAAPDAGENQIFVEGRFQRAGVGGAKNCARLFDVVGDSETGFGLAGNGEAIVKIASHPKVERPVPGRDYVLNVESEFLYVGMTVEREQASTARQVVGKQGWIEQRIERGVGRVAVGSGVGRITGEAALRRVREAGDGNVRVRCG